MAWCWVIVAVLARNLVPGMHVVLDQTIVRRVRSVFKLAKRRSRLYVVFDNFNFAMVSINDKLMVLV